MALVKIKLGTVLSLVKFSKNLHKLAIVVKILLKNFSANYVLWVIDLTVQNNLYNILIMDVKMDFKEKLPIGYFSLLFLIQYTQQYYITHKHICQILEKSSFFCITIIANIKKKKSSCTIIQRYRKCPNKHMRFGGKFFADRGKILINNLKTENKWKFPLTEGNFHKIQNK